MRINCPYTLPGVTAILMLPILVIVVGISFLLFNYFQTKQYYQRAEEITADLEDEINTLVDGFRNLGTTVSTNDQGKKTPDTNLNLIKLAKSQIGDLQSEYEELSSPNKATELDEKITSAFELANAFTRKYERTAHFNKDVYNAYGDYLNNELESFTKNYYRGRDR